MKKYEEIPKSDQREDLRQTEEEKKQPLFAGGRGKIISALLMLVILAIYMVYYLNGKSGSVACAMDDRTLGVSALSHPTLFIPYSEMEAISLAETVDMAEKISAEDWDSGWCGVYRNEDWGEYTLYAYSSVPEFIVIRHAGGTLIFNQKSARETESVYQSLQEHLSVR